MSRGAEPRAWGVTDPNEAHALAERDEDAPALEDRDPLLSTLPMELYDTAEGDPGESVSARLLSEISSASMRVASCPMGLLQRVAFEARVTYRIVWRDITASLLPATLFAMAALQATGQWTADSVATTLSRCFIYFSLYVYAFCLSNQIVGSAEDRVNKPDRVLPSGLITTRGAVIRWFVAMALFPTVAWLLGRWPILRWALAWQAIFIGYNFLGFHRHWFTKNIVFITSGTVALLAPAWELVAPLDDTAWRWIVVIAVAFGATLHLQDLRDIDGDRVVGRRTLPMVLGQERTRWFLEVTIGAFPAFMYFGLIHPAPLTTPVLVAQASLALINIVVAVRTVTLRTRTDDHHTYMMHTYWFCAVLASGLVIL